MTHASPPTRPSSSTRARRGRTPLPYVLPAASVTAPLMLWPCAEALHSPALRQSHPTSSP